jgi:cysteine desulfurase
LYVKKGIHLTPLIHGGGQERGRRAGTENALAVSSLGTAIRVLGPQLSGINGRIAQMRDQLEKKILLNISGCRVNGVESPRISNTTNILFDDVDGETLLINLDTRGFAVSSGAACSSGSNEPSPVLTAMGLNTNEASRSLRVSLGWMTTQEEVDAFYGQLVEALRQIREIHQLNSEAERELA